MTQAVFGENVDQVVPEEESPVLDQDVDDDAAAPEDSIDDGGEQQDVEEPEEPSPRRRQAAERPRRPDGTFAPAQQPQQDNRVSDELAAMQLRIAESQRQTQLLQQQLIDRRDADEVREYERQLTARGYEPTDVQFLSGQFRAVKQRERQAQQQAEMQQRNSQIAAQEQQAKLIVATQFAREYGVSVEEMLQYNSPELMEARAQLAKERREATESRRRTVRPTRVGVAANGAGGTGGSDASVWAAYGRGEVEWSGRVAEAGRRLGAI